MKFTTTNGREFRIRFSFPEKQLTITNGQKQTDLGTMVVCSLQTEGQDPISDASLLHPKDRMDKEIGRKIALARALVEFDKPSRQAAWKVYFARRAK